MDQDGILLGCIGRRMYHSLQAGTIPSPPEVAHCPDCRPQSNDVALTRQCHGSFEIPSRKAKPIPTGYHAALVVQVVSVLLLKGDLQGSVLGGDGGGIVPLEVLRLPVVEVDGLPIWVITGVEGSTVGVEFIREDQL